MVQARHRNIERRRRPIILAIIAILAGIVVVTLVWLVRGTIGPSVRQRVLFSIEVSTGLEPTVDSFELHLFPPRVEILDLRLTDGDRVVAVADSIRVRVRLLPLLRGELHLTDMEIVGPRLDWDAGRSLSAGGGEGGGAVRVDRFRLSGGRIDYRDPSRRLALHLEELEVRSERFFYGGRLSAFLSAARVGVEMADTHVSDLHLEGKITGDGGDWRIAAARTTTPVGDRIELEGNITFPAGFAEEPEFRFDIAVEVALERLRDWIPLPDRPAASGTLRWTGQMRGTPSRFELLGRVASEEVNVGPVSVSPLSARLSGSIGHLLLEEIEAGLLDGALAGRLGIENRDGAWFLIIDSSLRGARLDRIPLPAPPKPILPFLPEHLSAALEGSVPLVNPLRGPLAFLIRFPPEEEPDGRVNGIAGRLEGRIGESILSLNSGRLDSSGIALRLEGRAGLDGTISLPFDVEIPDLQYAGGRLARAFPVLGRWESVRPGGSLRLSGTLSRSILDPRLESRVIAQDLTIGGIPLGLLEADLVGDRRGFSFGDLHLQGPAGTAHAAGDLLLEGGFRVELEWTVDRLDLETLTGILGYPGGGNGWVSANGRFSWGETGPALELTAAGEQLELFGIEIDRAAVEGRVDSAGIRIDKLALRQAETVFQATGILNFGEGEGDLAIQLTDLSLDRLPGFADFEGRVSLEGRVAGHWPDLHLLGPATFRIDSLAWKETSRFNLAGTIESEPQGLRLAFGSSPPFLAGEIDLPFVAGAIARASIDLAPGGIEIPTPAGFPVRIDTGGIRIQAAAPVGRWRQPDLRIVAEDLVVSSQDWTIRAVAPVTAGGAAGTVVLAPAEFRMDDLAFTIEGSATIADPPIYSLSVRGNPDLKLLAPFLPDARLAGAVTVDMRLAGAGDQIDWHGSLQVSKGFLKLEGFPNSLEEVGARIDLDRQRLTLSELTGRIGAGTIRGSGEADLAAGFPGRYRMEVEGSGVGLKLMPEFETISDFHLAITGAAEQTPRITGTVQVNRGRLTRDFELEKSILSRSLPGVIRAAPPGPLDRFAIDIGIEADNGIWIDNDFARAEFSAALHLTGTAGRPQILGAMQLVDTGRVRFQRVKYDLLDAALQFGVAAPNDPGLNMVARSRVGLYEVTLTVTGRLSNPRLELTSDPELPTERIVALLLTGGSWGSGENGEISREYAVAYLAGKLEPAQEAIRRVTGLDVGVDPVFVEGQGDPTARVTIGRQVSHRLRAAYSTALGTAERDIAEIRYRMFPRLELRQAREDTGQNIIEARYVRSFHTGTRRNPDGVGTVGRLKPHRVGSVEIEGAPGGLDRESLLEAVDLVPESRIDRFDLVAASRRAQRHMIRSGYPLARADCEGIEVPASDRPVPVVCRIAPGRPMRIEITGISDRRVRQVLESIHDEWETIAYPEDLAPAAVRATERFFHEHGHARVDVEAVSADADALRIRVDPGPRVRVAAVRIVGGEGLPRERVDRHLLTMLRTGGRSPVLVAGMVDGDEDTLRRLYYGSGFLDVDLPEPAAIAYPKQPDRAEIIFHVEPGPRSALVEFDFRGNRRFDPADLESRLGISPGGFPEPEVLEGFANRLQGDYDQEGFPDATVTWWLEPSPAGARAVFDIHEGPQVRVRAVRVTGNLLTREEVIRREVTLRTGQPFRRQDLLATQRQIHRLGLFRSVMVREDQVPGGDSLRDVALHVIEKDNLDLAFGFGFDNAEGARTSFSLGHRNLWGRNGSAGVQLRYGGADRLAQLLGGQKRFLGSRYDFLASLLAREEERDGFTVRRYGASAQLSRPIGAHVRGTARYRLQNVGLKDLNIPAAQTGENEGILASLGFALHRDRRDDPPNPQSGSFHGIDFDLFAEPIGSEEKLVKLFTQHSRFWRLDRRGTVFGTGLRLGAAWPYGDTDNVPLSEHFFGGGVTTVRGFGLNELGPRNPMTGDPIGGDAVFILNQELRQPFGRLLEGILFVDAGNVFVRPSDLGLSELQWTAGIGFGISTPVGPFRFYRGWKLNREPGDPESGEFHFTFGPTF